MPLNKEISAAAYHRHGVSRYSIGPVARAQRQKGQMPTNPTIRTAITFDIDWAPDWCIERCVEILDRFGVKATFFATHASPALEEIKRRRERFEVGLHPNFHPGSTHGSETSAVIEHCLEFAADARAMRTHGLMQWSNLFALLANSFPQIETDVSTFLPGQQSYRGSYFFLDGMSAPVTKLAYRWEDDIAAALPSYDWSALPVLVDGLNIFNFHPIHVGLNMETMSRYRALGTALGNKRLAEAREEEVAGLVNSGAGTVTAVERICAIVRETGSFTISELGDGFRQANPWPPMERGWKPA
jgi:hypothetical protein